MPNFDSNFLLSLPPPHVSVLDKPQQTIVKVQEWSSDELAKFLLDIEPRIFAEVLVKIVQFSARVRRLCEDPVSQLEEPISLRQLIRATKRAAKYPGEVAQNLMSICFLRNYIIS